MSQSATRTSTENDADFVRHRGPVTCVAGLPGGRVAVSSAYDGAVAFIDLDASSIELLGYHDHLVNRISVNESGTKAASSSSDFTVAIWDLQNRRLERRLRGHSDDVEDFVFVDESTGVSVSRDCRVLVWNLDTGAIIRTIEGHEKDVLSVVHYDGKIFTSGDDMTLRVWDLQTGDLQQMWGPFDTETDSCAIDPINKRAILGCDDGVIRVFDFESGESVAEIDAHASGIKKVAASPATGDIFSAAYDQRILVWDAKDFSLKVALETRPSMWERSFNWSPDGSRLLAGTFDGTILEWDAVSGRFLSETGGGNGNACLNDVSANDRGDFAIVSDDGLVRLGKLTSEEAVLAAEVEPASGRVLANAVTLDDRGSRVIVGAHNQTLMLLDHHDSSVTGELTVPLGEGPINCVRIAHHAGFEDETFVACYSGAIVRVARDGTIQSQIRVHDGAVKALRLHPTEAIGVSCSADGAVLSWGFDGAVRNVFLGHMAIVDDVDISPSGTKIASVSRDFTLKVYNLDDAQLLHSVALGRRSPKGLLFLDDDTVIVTNYWGELIRIELSGERVLRRPIAKNGISAVTRTGEHLMAVSYDGAAYLVDPTDLSVLNTLRWMTQRLHASALIP